MFNFTGITTSTKANQKKHKSKLKSTNTGSYQVYSHLRSYYISTRFRVEDDIWPPIQPKHFTPLILIHQDCQRSEEETRAMAAATVKGHIDEYCYATRNKINKNLKELSSLLDQSVYKQQSCIVLVEGSPGIGKSILLKHISYLWARGELLTKSKFLFLLHLQDPDVHKIKSLKDLVSYLYHHDHDKLIAESCVTEILEDSGNVLTILLDGYDELPDDLRKVGFISDILQHKILPCCGIVVSSRPYASTKLRSNATCTIEILGFSEDDQKDFIYQSLEKVSDQNHKITELNKYLKTHPTIASLCYIPFYMTILLFLYMQEKILPTNSTELYNLFICMTIHRHLARSGIKIVEDITDLNCLPLPYKSVIDKLSKLAFEALEEMKLVFSKEEIKKQCPEIVDTPGAINGFGILQAVEYFGRLSKHISFNFIHLSVQEFLAAMYVTNLSPEEEFKILNNKFWEKNYQNVFAFYVALTKGQRQSFRKFLRGNNSDNETFIIDYRLLRDWLGSIQLYRCLKEAADDGMCTAIEKKFSDGEIDLDSSTLSASDVEAIGIFLTSTTIIKWKELNLGNCHIQYAGIRILHRSLQASSITIETLKLHSNDLFSSCDGCLADIVINCRIKILDISYNKTIGQTERFFHTILTDKSSYLERLYITEINLSSKTAIIMLNLLKKNTKLKELGMANNNITGDVGDAMAKTLQVNQTLEYLNIDGSKISKRSILHILTSLKLNDSLKVLWLPSNYIGCSEKEILLLEVAVNNKRKYRGCQEKLKLNYDNDSY